MSWALIVGASGDIGGSIARNLASQGWSLYLHYSNNQSRVNSLIDEFNQLYPKQDFLAVQADFLEVKKTVTKIKDTLFSLDAVIFTQGTTTYGLLNSVDSGELDNMWRMQVLTPMSLVKNIEDKLAMSKAPRIVFIGSVYGGAGSAMEVGYSTVKGALTAFAKAYSKEVASLGITVNVIAPGAVDTQMNSIFSSDDKEEISGQIPKGRFANVDEVSYWVETLLDERAGYLTGQTIYVTGGWLE